MLLLILKELGAGIGQGPAQDENDPRTWIYDFKLDLFGRNIIQSEGVMKFNPCGLLSLGDSLRHSHSGSQSQKYRSISQNHLER